MTTAPAVAQFVHESSMGATPYDVDVTPNGAIAVVRGITTGIPASGSDERVSFWRTDTTTGTRLTPSPALTVGRGNLTTSGGIATFSNAIALNNERAVIIGSRDSTFDGFEDTTYVDIVAFDYTQIPPLVTVLATHPLGGGSDPSTRAGLAHDVAVTPDGTLAVVSGRNWIHVFELMGGSLVAAFNVGGAASPSGAGPCSAGFARNSLELTNERAVVAMSRPIPSFPSHARTWTYIIDLSWNPPSTLPTLVLEHELLPDPNREEQKPHDLAISPDGTLAGVSAYGTFGLYELTGNTFLGGHYDIHRWKETIGCGALWDSIEMSNTRAVVLSDTEEQILPPPATGCELKYAWRAQVFQIASASAPVLISTFGDVLAASDGFNQAWDVSLSGDGTLAAIKNAGSDVAIIGVDTLTPSLVELGSIYIPGSVWSGALYDPANTFDRMNDAVGITRGFVSPSLPTDPPGTVNSHRWVAYTGKLFGPGATIDTSKVVFHDLAQVIAGKPSNPKTFDLTSPTFDTWVVDLELNAGMAKVLLRSTAPPDEPDPSAGGRDWFSFDSHNTNPPGTSANVGGKGTCLGVDNLIERRGVSVSISGGVGDTGWVHVVRTL